MYTYRQASGAFYRDDLLIATGYSGSGAGKNNPAMQEVHDVGPIPEGEYDIGKAHYDAAKGTWVMPLTPRPGTEMFGRSGFLIHGDSIAHPGSASRGCIILAHDVREGIAGREDKLLRVTP